jgi:DNA polymerase III epsilon subunit-like protein
VPVLLGGPLKDLRLIRPFFKDILVVDLETTGSNPLIHEVVEMGAVLLDKDTLRQVRSIQSLVRPESLDRSEPLAMKIHGLLPDQLLQAPSASQVVSHLIDTLGHGYTLCGWNICFDTQFLAGMFRRAGKYEEFTKLDYHRLDLWSLVQLAWTCGLVEEEPTSLSRICTSWGIQRQENHSALQDALISAEVLRRVVHVLEEARIERSL